MTKVACLALFAFVLAVFARTALGVDCNACGYSCSWRDFSCPLKKRACFAQGEGVRLDKVLVDASCNLFEPSDDFDFRLDRALAFIDECENSLGMARASFDGLDLKSCRSVCLGAEAMVLNEHKIRFCSEIVSQYKTRTFAATLVHEYKHILQNRAWGQPGFDCRYGQEVYIKFTGFDRGNWVEREAYEFEDVFKRECTDKYLEVVEFKSQCSTTVELFTFQGSNRVVRRLEPGGTLRYLSSVDHVEYIARTSDGQWFRTNTDGSDEVIDGHFVKLARLNVDENHGLLEFLTCDTDGFQLVPINALSCEECGPGTTCATGTECKILFPHMGPQKYCGGGAAKCGRCQTCSHNSQCFPWIPCINGRCRNSASEVCGADTCERCDAANSCPSGTECKVLFPHMGPQKYCGGGDVKCGRCQTCSTRSECFPWIPCINGRCRDSATEVCRTETCHTCDAANTCPPGTECKVLFPHMGSQRHCGGGDAKCGRCQVCSRDSECFPWIPCINGHCRNSADEICRTETCHTCDDHTRCPTGTECKVLFPHMGSQRYCGGGDAKCGRCQVCSRDSECFPWIPCINGHCRNSADEICRTETCHPCSEFTECPIGTSCRVLYPSEDSDANAGEQEYCGGGETKCGQCESCHEDSQCFPWMSCVNGQCQEGNNILEGACTTPAPPILSSTPPPSQNPQTPITSVSVLSSDGWVAWSSGEQQGYATNIAGQDGALALLELEINTVGMLELDVFVDSEEYDLLKVRLDDEEMFSGSGTNVRSTLQLAVVEGSVISLTFEKGQDTSDFRNVARLEGLRLVACLECEVSAWSAFTKCSCHGQQARTRSVTIQPTCSEASCPVLTESKSCIPNESLCSTDPPAPRPALDAKTQKEYENAVTLMQSANWRSRTAVQDFYAAIEGSNRLVVEPGEDIANVVLDSESEHAVAANPETCQAALSQFDPFANFLNNRFRVLKQRVNKYVAQGRRVVYVPTDQLVRALLNETEDAFELHTGDALLSRQSGSTRLDPATMKTYRNVLKLAQSANWRSRTAIEDFNAFVGLRRDLADVPGAHEIGMDMHEEELEAMLLRSVENPMSCLETMQIFKRSFTVLNNRFKRFKATVGVWVRNRAE